MDRHSCFNPRPCRRGDLKLSQRHWTRQGFNPRPCRRGDPLKVSEIRSLCVSIHAPAGGATNRGQQLKYGELFQSTPLQEGRPMTVTPGSRKTKFQSTPLQEGRRVMRVLIINGLVFQSTPLQEGRRIKGLGKMVDSGVSIHAPAGGATSVDFRTLVDPLFQSTPLQEGRHVDYKGGPGGKRFQSTPLQEGRRHPDIILTLRSCFNPRPCRRGD